MTDRRGQSVWTQWSITTSSHGLSHRSAEIQDEEMLEEGLQWRPQHKVHHTNTAPPKKSISWCAMPHGNNSHLKSETQQALSKEKGRSYDVFVSLPLSHHPSSTSRVGSQLRWCLSIYTASLLCRCNTLQHVNLSYGMSKFPEQLYLCVHP